MIIKMELAGNKGCAVYECDRYRQRIHDATRRTIELHGKDGQLIHDYDVADTDVYVVSDLGKTIDHLS